MSAKQTALNYLNRDFVINCNLINAINENIVKEYLYSADDGVFLYTTDDMYYLSTDGKCVAEKIFKYVFENRTAFPNFPFDKDKYCIFVCQHLYDYEVAYAHMNFTWKNECYQVAYNESALHPVQDDIKIRKLDLSYAQTMADHYKLKPSLAHAVSAIKYCGVYGAFVGEDLAGFIGFHEERSIGMLEVFPEYKRRGIGTSLINFMINVCCEMNRIPYCHIIKDNVISYELHKKMDCEISETTVFWAGRNDKD